MVVIALAQQNLFVLTTEIEVHRSGTTFSALIAVENSLAVHYWKFFSKLNAKLENPSSIHFILCLLIYQKNTMPLV